jgi:hypothetical protein
MTQVEWPHIDKYPVTYELTIYITGIGSTRVTSDNPSVLLPKSLSGHMWYGITASTGESSSYGFAPEEQKIGVMPVLGKFYEDDTKTYIDPAYKRTMRISKDEYLALQQFGEKPLDNGFKSQQWTAFTNTCIDFVWAALKRAGLNPSGHQGSLMPDGWLLGNRDNLDRYMKLSVEQQRHNKEIMDQFNKLKFPLLYEAGLFDVDYGLGDIPGIGNDANRFGDAENTKSPLILDLNGDGVKTLNKTAGKHFDHAGDGFAERTGWVDKDDGLLVRDLNGDGKITSGRELFGNHTLLKNGINAGKQAANGFEALKDLDSNADGLVDDKDAGFASLRVWKDTNGNGLTDTGELLSLAQAGVKSLKVAYTDAGSSAEADAQGNQHQQLGAFTQTDGSTQNMHDVWFATSSWDTIDQRSPLALSAAIAALPEMEGRGTLGSLHQAMGRDAKNESHYLRRYS